MFDLLWLIPGLPLVAFIVLTMLGRHIGPRAVAVIGTGGAGMSAMIAMGIAWRFLCCPPAGHAFRQTLWTWIHIDGFSPQIALYLDPLSLVMMTVVTFVGFLIFLYSTQFMAGDEDYTRFFAYMNLFLASMLILVLAENLVLLYLGWEGVGLCSYLLIGFWYRDPVNGRAARKAFLVTRIGDTAMCVGLLLLFTHLGTLGIQDLMGRSTQAWHTGSSLANWGALLLLGGALGKSAQLPLQTWLPDAMAGPTPVSALIHAATMVTAGVYLIARMHVLFELAPAVQAAVAAIGAATLLYAGCSALAQRDIKRVLAYSTISQIGYMFVALGVGAYTAGIFHFMTHAFFKSLLFLAAGAVILAMHHEHDMFRMGGLRKAMPVTFWTFLIGAASLSSLPLVTAGFYSKDMILYEVFVSPSGGAALWAAGLLGALLTSLYTFRMVFITFMGPIRQQPVTRPGACMIIAMVVLAALSVVGGFVQTPAAFGGLHGMADLLGSVFGQTHTAHGAAGMAEGAAGVSEGVLQALASAASIAGIALAYVLYLQPGLAGRLIQWPAAQAVRQFWLGGWGFDWLYDRVLVRPFIRVAQINRDDVIDSFFSGVAYVAAASHLAFRATQTGRIRWYAAAMVVGAIIVIGIAVLL